MRNLFDGNRLIELLSVFRRTPSLTAAALAARLDVSERTIRNDLKLLNEELKNSASIEGDQGKYTLHVYDTERFQEDCARLMESDDYLNSPRNRTDYVFGRLLRARDALLTDELAYEMNISRGTLVNDLRRLRTEIAPYHLSIVGKTSKGLTLEGRESGIRQYILENAYEALYREYPMEPEIDAIVEEVFTDSPFEGDVRAAFRRFLTVMLDRFLTDHPIGELSAAFYNFTTRPEFTVVDRLMGRVEDFLNVEFPPEERLFVFLPIIGMRTPADVQNMQSIALDPAMVPLGEKLFERIRREMDIQIEDPDAIEEFLYHLMFMVNRLRFKVRLKSPILEELREKYPLAWQMADIAAGVVEEEYAVSVTPDERSYLATYFGVFLEEREEKRKNPFRAAVVCGPGRVTSRLVSAQLRKVLDGELTVLTDSGVTSERLADFDIIFTTVPLSCKTDRPVITIQEIFNEQELRAKIEKARYWDQVDIPVLDSNWFVMVGLLDASRFFVFDSPVSYEDAVDKMARCLTEKGQADGDFPDRLRERERMGTMVFDHAVAIPHAVQFAVPRLVLSIGVFPEPIRYQDHEIRVIFLMGLPEQVSSDDRLLIRVYEEIISVTQDPALLEKVAGAGDYQALLRALYRQA